MRSLKRLFVGLIVIGLGLAASLPFQRARPRQAVQEPRETRGQGLLWLRATAEIPAQPKPNKAFQEVHHPGPLESPAERRGARVDKVVSLDQVGRPPDLASEFQSLGGQRAAAAYEESSPQRGAGGHGPDGSATPRLSPSHQSSPRQGEGERPLLEMMLRSGSDSSAHDLEQQDPTLSSQRPLPSDRTPPPSSPPTESTRQTIRHRIVDGDRLEDLARRYLGEASRWTEIYEANRAVLEQPDLLPIGKELLIECLREKQNPAGSYARAKGIDPASGRGSDQ